MLFGLSLCDLTIGVLVSKGNVCESIQANICKVIVGFIDFLCNFIPFLDKFEICETSANDSIFFKKFKILEGNLLQKKLIFS